MRRIGITLVAALVVLPIAGPAYAAPATESAPRASLDWRSCGSSLPSTARCATLTVPRDWGNDRVDGTYRISVAKIPAQKPSERIGVITFNPGGPGSAAVSNITWVQGMLPQRVRDRFDIVAWDPRGVGGSEPSISGCSVKDISPPKTGPVDWDAWAEKYMRVNGEAAAACFEANKRHAPYVGTWQLVRDLDALRAARGEETITFWGMSYGSTAGSGPSRRSKIHAVRSGHSRAARRTASGRVAGAVTERGYSASSAGGRRCRGAGCACRRDSE